jgi:hypothetical protein
MVRRIFYVGIIATYVVEGFVVKVWFVWRKLAEEER